MTEVIVSSVALIANIIAGAVMADFIDHRYKSSFKTLYREKPVHKFLFGSIAGIISLFLVHFYLIENYNFFSVGAYVIFNAAILILLFSAYFDLKYFEVLDGLTKYVIIFLISVHIFSLLLLPQDQFELFNGFYYNSLNHLWGGLMGWIIFLVIVRFTGGRGMGTGDIVIASIIGLTIGFMKLIVALYISIFTALLVSSLIITLSRKKDIHSKIPFVPFLVFGGISALFLPYTDILELIEGLL